MTVSEITRHAFADRPLNTAPGEWAVRRILAGWTPRAVATAVGCSERTIYRWAAELLSVEDVTVGGFTAPFALRRTLPPVRLGPWRRVP